MSRQKDIEHAAATWAMRRQEPGWSAAEQHELDRWLEASVAHKAALWRLEYGYSQLDRLSVLAGSDNPRSPPPTARWRSAWRAASRPMKAWPHSMFMAVSLAVIFVVGYSLIIAPMQSAEVIQGTTKFGQIGALRLPDGSHIDLNTNTDMRIAQSPTERALWLDKGEAYFEIAHERKRPFVIHAGPSTITVLGTKFVVRRNDSTVTVSVVDGLVRLTPATGVNSGSATIARGDIAIVDGNSMRITANELDQIKRGMAWRYGKVVFDDTRLADAAAQFNRYNVRRLIVAGKAADLRIGGSFRLGNADGFARLLERVYGLQVTFSENAINVSDR